MGLPADKTGKIEYCEARVTPFAAHAVAIGTTAPIVTDYTTKVENARAALSAQTAAQNAAIAATNDLKIAISAMVAAFSGIAKQVDVKAMTAGDGVYSLANLPPPATPTPMGPLGQPSEFKAALTQDGFLDTSWKNTNPRGAGGAVYQIWRRTTPMGEFEYLGGVGGKKFTDTTIPAGSSQVTYKIQAVRSTSIGPAATFNVTFGVGGAGGFVASVVETTPKMAA